MREVEIRRWRMLLVGYQPKERMPGIYAAISGRVVDNGWSKDDPVELYFHLAAGALVTSPGQVTACREARIRRERGLDRPRGAPRTACVADRGAAHAERATFLDEACVGREFVGHEMPKQAR